MTGASTPSQLLPGISFETDPFPFCRAISLHLEALRSHPVFHIKAGGDPCSIAPQEGPF